MNDDAELEMSGHDESRYSLTVEQSSLRFVDAGLPRSPRTVIRYCTQGHLDCVKVDTERNERYLISEESVERRIEEIRQAYPSRRGATEHDSARHVESQPDTSRQDVEEVPTFRERVIELERENLDLKIANRAKDQFITMAREQMAGLQGEVREQAYRLGELETRLRLAAPREDHAKHRLEETESFPQASASESIDRRLE